MSKMKDENKAGGRSRRDDSKERKWRGLIERQRRSGQSVRAFCRSRDLHETSFYYWRREIGLRDRETAGGQVPTSAAGNTSSAAEITSPVSAKTCSNAGKRESAKAGRRASGLLAPVVFVDEPQDAPGGSCDLPSRDAVSAIEIVLDGGTTIRVPRHSTREQLAAVLDVLEQTRC